MKKLMIVLTILAVIVLGVFMAFNAINSNLEALKDMTLSDVDLGNLADGTYTGTHKVFPVDVEVKVTIKDHAITDIQLVKHSNGQGGAAEVIPGKVIESQSLQIDAVSGATYSSKVILKAIENALNSTK